MKRGSRFFVEFAGEGTQVIKGGKGRSVKLLERRNEKIFYRYYYYSRILQMNYDKVLQALIADFDLSESTLIQLIGKNTKRISDIKNKRLNRAQLKKLFPHFFWFDKAAVVVEVKEREVYKGFDEQKAKSG